MSADMTGRVPASPPDVRQGSALPATFGLCPWFGLGPQDLGPKAAPGAQPTLLIGSDDKAKPCLQSGGEADARYVIDFGAKPRQFRKTTSEGSRSECKIRLSKDIVCRLSRGICGCSKRTRNCLTGSNSPCLSKAILMSKYSKRRCKILSLDTKYTEQVFAPFQACRCRFKLSKIARRSHSGSWILGRCAPASKRARLKTCFARPDLSRLIWKMVHCFVCHS